MAVANDSLNHPPQARESIVVQGLIFTDAAYLAAQAARLDWYRMLTLALADRDTSQPRYRQAYAAYFDAWLERYQPSFDPINEADFHYFVLSVDLEREHLSADQLQAAGRLFRKMAWAYLDPRRYYPGTADNNWQSHRIKIVAALAFALRDPELIKRCRAMFKQQIANNLRADGSVIDFYQRDALHYVVYSLEPLLIASLIARQNGEDWFLYHSPTGSSLDRSLQWLSAYARGEKTHEEFVHTTAAVDRRRAVAGHPLFSGRWQPVRAARCYQMAARLDPQWTALAAQLGPAPDWLDRLFPRVPKPR